VERRDLEGTDDDSLTLRAPRWLVALVVAVALHVGASALSFLLPTPKKRPQRIEIALSPAKPPAAEAPRAPRATGPAEPVARPALPRRARPATPPPATSPVLPERPATESPPEDRPVLPEVERAPAPAPPPAPSTWKERALAQLAQTRPRPAREPSGPLAPSLAGLERVALSDVRMRDEETERRMQEDFGPFLRRGIEALRGNWHPAEVLRATERVPSRRCGVQTRTTFAVAVLDRDGNVIDVDLKAPSGCPDLDDEAVRAFKRVAQFPHPPGGMFVAPDGSPMATARYPVRFIVTFDGGLRLDWR
jgi:TonB family protein